MDQGNSPQKDVAPIRNRSAKRSNMEVCMVNKKCSPGQFNLSDLNVGTLAQLSWEELSPVQWEERMADMHWILDMLYCARILGGLRHLSWEVAKKMTFTQYMQAVRAKNRHAV
jgi:hypothetical protein